MAPKYKIAVIQLYPKPLQPEANFERAAKYVRSAAQQGCHLAVLPEYHLTNWLPKDRRFISVCSTWRTYLRRYQDLARECNISIVPGTIVQTPDEASSSPLPPSKTSVIASELEAHAPPKNTGGAPSTSSSFSSAPPTLRNAAHFISPTGQILHTYHKTNLWGPTERSHLLPTSSPAQPHTAFSSPLGTIGLLTCWDLAFPEAFRALVRQGAKLIVVPSFWTLSDASDAGLKHNANAERLFVDSALVTRAFEGTCAVVFANAGGPPGRGYMGDSQIVVPFVGDVVRLGTCGEGMGIGEVDMAIVEDAEDNYRVREDLGRVGWHYGYEKGVHGGVDGRERDEGSVGRGSKL